jgi:salicylate hydroxylase
LSLQAADGIKSVVRQVVVGDSAFTTARPSGLSAFRFTLEASEVLKAFGELPEVLQKDKPVCLTMLFSMNGSKRGMVLYPCRHFELLNFVCIVPDSALKGETTESWSAVGNPAEMVSLLGDFPDWAVRYMKLGLTLVLPPLSIRRDFC